MTSAPKSCIRLRGRRTELCSIELVDDLVARPHQTEIARFSASVALVQKAIRSGASALISLASPARVR